MSQYKALEKIKISKIVKKIWLITFLLIVLLIAILFLPWQQNIKGYGELIAYNPEERPYKVYAPISGFIEKFLVKEDIFVKKGTPLVIMRDLDKNYFENLDKIKKNIQRQLKNLQINLSLLQNKKENLKENLKIGLNVYNNKMKKIQNKIKSLENKSVSLKKNLEITKINYERIKKLYKEGIESKRKFELEENKFIKAKIDYENNILEIKIQKRELEITKQEREKFKREATNKILETKKQIQDTKLKIQKLNEELTKINIKISRYKTATIYAKEDGFIVRILKNDKNQYIKKGEPLFIFSPSYKSRAILVKFRPLDMPLVKKGLPVRIQFEGWPALQIPGWPRISVGTFSGHIEKVDPLPQKDGGFYAFVVEDFKDEWPDKENLKIGTKATVWVRLSTVPIWYEIWRQVNAFPPKMVNLKPEEAKK